MFSEVHDVSLGVTCMVHISGHSLVGLLVDNAIFQSTLSIANLCSNLDAIIQKILHAVTRLHNKIDA